MFNGFVGYTYQKCAIKHIELRKDGIKWEKAPEKAIDNHDWQIELIVGFLPYHWINRSMELLIRDLIGFSPLASWHNAQLLLCIWKFICGTMTLGRTEACRKRRRRFDWAKSSCSRLKTRERKSEWYITKYQWTEWAEQKKFHSWMI